MAQLGLGVISLIGLVFAVYGMVFSRDARASYGEPRGGRGGAARGGASTEHLPASPATAVAQGRVALRVVATAGHVDHGKSTLVRALTGTDPDRWDEEKRRGLTIDLGFAATTLPSGAGISFVDVPGHVRFLPNMLAGVGAVDACLFVVAATEGWKPQSEEHLRILELLGLGHGVVALTKVGLVDDDGVEPGPPRPRRPPRRLAARRRRGRRRRRADRASGSARCGSPSTASSPTTPAGRRRRAGPPLGRPVLRRPAARAPS